MNFKKEENHIPSSHLFFEAKPFIEITCIQGEFNPGKVMREEVA